ncbi:hypothetical protein TEA_023183 [Camellia sinensis var. sinensis]|uniref:Small ribosomal subunit protein uS7m n=1 Tax=Camellia sinensis var. sinensis TaxID=542762 RepID=A0A4S4EZ64_CAMSN|nr:hypothetical protein TEA_023183 [Camellia sinensis var. sinensis]
MGGLDGEQKQLIKKLVNFRTKEGKRTRVRAIVYQTFHRPARTERDVIKLMVDALENIKPICEVEKVGIAGTIYDVPGIVARDRQQTLAIRWILEGAFKRRISHRISLEKCSFAEILDAYRKRGIARKKRENLHGLASTNRSFAHFRWWYEAASKPSSYASLAIDHKDIYKIRTSAPRARICHSTSPSLPKHSYSLGSQGWPTKQAFESPSGVGKGRDAIPGFHSLPPPWRVPSPEITVLAWSN